MKKNYISVIVLLLFNLAIFSQTPTFAWAKRMGNSSVDIGHSVITDGSGNVFTTGFFNGTVDFDPGAGTFNLTSAAGFDDAFIQKLDANGNFLWAKQIGSASALSDYGNGVTVDGSGNVYITGQFQGTVDFDPGAGVFNLTSVGAYDVFIQKLDANGNFLWAKQIGSSGSDIGYAIKIDGSGNVYTTGVFQSSADFDPGAGVFILSTNGGDDVFIQKLDASGNFIWAKTFGGTASDFAYSITTDVSGNVFTTGYFVGLNADFDPSAGVFNLSSVGAEDIFIQKLDASGNFLWAKRMGNTTNDIGYSISADGSGNVFTTGHFRSFVDFDPGAGVFNLTSAGIEDIFIQKLDASGNFLWAIRMGSTQTDIGYGLSSDGSGNIYTTGFFGQTVDFDPGAGVFNLTSAASDDIFISKLDANGNFLWAVSMGGSSADQGRSIALDASGNIHTTGAFRSTFDFDPGAGVFNMTGFLVDVFVHKLAPCASAPSQPATISGSTSLCTGAGATIYSIAIVAGATSYSWSLPGGWTGSSATNTISATPGSSGIFTVTASNACGMSAQQTLSVTVNALPTITANSGSICSGNSFTIVPSGANTYTIQGGSAVVSPTTNTSYTVIGTSAAGCVSASSATTNVTVVSTPTANAGSSQTLTCSNPTLSLNGSGVTSYTWTGPGIILGSNTANPVVNASGTYSLIGNSGGCNSSNTATVSIASNTTTPSLTIAAPNNTICSGNSVTLTASGANTYSWNTGPTSTTINVSPSITTIYNVSGTNTANGCTSNLNKTITVNQTPTVSVSGGAICPGNSFTFNPSGASTYTYSGGQVVSPTVTTNYTVTGTSSLGCVSNAVVVTVTVAGTLTVTITGSNTVCNGNPINLTAGGATTYTWNTGATTTTIAPTPSVNTTYSVIGASGSCSNTSILSVTVNPTPTISAITNNTLLCVGQSATLTASGASTYTFNPGGAGASIVVSPTITSNYTITGTSAQGCNNISVFTQSVSTCSGLNQIKNSISELNIYPNPFSIKITIASNDAKQIVQIFNVLGEIIFTSQIENEKLQIDLTQHSSGIYFVRMGLVTRKIIKE